MKILVTGVNGQLGYDVARTAIQNGFDVVASDIQNKTTLNIKYVSLDITDKETVMKTIGEIRPDAVIHCAAWTAVDLAEREENRDKVYSINHLGTKYIAEACLNVNAKMMYFSTDYVFSGTGTIPWSSEETDFEPLNVYGDSKLQGEKAVKELLNNYFVIRTSWVFGFNGNNFVKTMLKLSESHRDLKVVNDQTGTPTYTRDLARLVIDMVQTEKYGTYNATNEGGYISWYEFAVEILRQAEKETKVIPVTTDEYGISLAKRPFNSRLDTTKLKENGFDLLPNWRDALKSYLIELKKNNKQETGEKIL